MNRRITASALCVGLLAVSLSVAAQGRRPSGAPAGGFGQRPSFGQPQESGRISAEIRRQEAAARRQQAEARRQEAELRRQQAELRRQQAQENNRSAEARAEHPPNEQAADEAFLAEQNADNQDLRDQRRDLQGDNRGDHGTDR